MPKCLPSVPVVLLVAFSIAVAQSPAKRPRFDDYGVSRTWGGKAAPISLALPSERMFKTRLTEALSQPPNFADHYRFTSWGCGSNCNAGAFIDLQTGRVIPPPLTAGTTGWDRWTYCWQAFEGAGVWTRPDSRLLIIRCGKTYNPRLDDVVPDTYYQESRRRQPIEIIGDILVSRAGLEPATL
jgi:hypothetical protein